MAQLSLGTSPHFGPKGKTCRKLKLRSSPRNKSMGLIKLPPRKTKSNETVIVVTSVDLEDEDTVTDGAEWRIMISSRDSWESDDGSTLRGSQSDGQSLWWL